MSKPQLIAIGGMAYAGKTTLAEILSQRLNCYHQDIDRLRIDVFGWKNHPLPDPGLVDLSSLARQDQKERRASYYMLMAMAEAFLEMGHSIIISATFGKKEYQDKLKHVALKTGADLKLIRCITVSASREEIERRIASKPFGIGYNVSLPVNYEQYLWGLTQQQEFTEPHLFIDTAKALDECVATALDYIRSA